ncbi:MAG: TolC family protein, partial [Clostridia bacterium]|nr:TolC family protein [Clostridia bacterium]
MKLLQKTLLCSVFGLLAAGHPAAQEAWTLERCLDYAAVHNLRLREQEAVIDLRRTELLQRRAALLPTVHLAAGQDWNWGRSVDMQELVIIRNKLTQATAVSVNASWNLFNGFSREYAQLAARSSLEAAGYEAQQLRDALRIDVTRAYLELMLARQMSRYAAENYATILRQRERTAQLVEAGSQPKSALHEMEAQVAADRSAMVEAECAVRSAAQALMQLMNLPYDASFATGDGFGEEPVRERIPLVTAGQV